MPPKINFLLSAGTAIIPLLLGFIWYHPKVFGTPWMKGAGLTEEDSKKLNKPLVFGLSYVFGYVLSLTLHGITIHQFSIGSLIMPEAGRPLPAENIELGKQTLEAFAGSYRTFHHGVIHAVITGIFFVLPLTAISAMFEFRGWKYILINASYWIVALGLMGGIICQFA